MGSWELVGPFRLGAYSITGPNGERVFIEWQDEPRDSEKARMFAEKILEACKMNANS